MNCQDVREAASVALLTRAPEPGVVSEHLADCAACREELAELSPLVGLLSLAPDVPASTPPDEFCLLYTSDAADE